MSAGFTLSEDQQIILDAADRYGRERLAPLARRMDDEEWWPDEAFRALGREGYLGITVPTELEGAGLDLFASGLVLQGFSRWNYALGLSWVAHENLCLNNILRNGSREQIERYIPGLSNGTLIGCLGLTEPGAGSDAFGSMRTTARRVGDEYVLNGQKTFITNAPYADLFVVYAKLEEDGERSIQPFLVERGTPGLETSKPFRKMGMHAAPTGAVYLDEVRVPKDHLLGGGVRERGHVKARLADERAGMPTLSLGLADRAFEIARNYALEREQFGQPIANFQLVQRRLARMYALLCNMRNFVFLDFLSGRRVPRTVAEISAGKLYCCEAATQITLEAIHILGGNGYMEEYEVERLARDAKLLELGGGTTEIQELTIARELVGRR